MLSNSAKVLLGTITAIASGGLLAEPVSTLGNFFIADGQAVTAATYPTVETSHQMLKNQDAVGVNHFLHKRQLTPTDQQPVVRMNRDTYYSFAVVDVSKGATVTMPEVPTGKYISVQPVTEDHRIQPMSYGAGTFELTSHSGKHVYLVIRLDATFTEAEAAKLQDQMSISANSDQLFQAEPVNQQSFKTVEADLKAQMPAIFKRDGVNALNGMFTAPDDDSAQFFSEEKYQVGAAIGWGGAQMVDNIYEVSGNYPANSCHQASFKDPKNKAFWSITVYNKSGFMFNDAANVSSNTAVKNADGSYTVSFGCGEKAPNNIVTENDSGVFNLGIRHYQPSDLVRVDGFRILPTVQVVK
ncbi:hypothetical protein SIN8267_01193 [Sinobacterium norvegicum]|uniref:DUF1254 domain-containing protein n=1 Tax=Sinobacterium norvegicum TaxID=1641715 RepID=A0ABM9ADN0_9GAMM|nr:DUF1214 domain-containing protein [Sinobacterium norvegicum]CAH0991092.1 hypothetical protein SIN8267_01193 [Sinobacterium norvegicum]